MEECITLPSTTIYISCFSSIEDRKAAYAQIQDNISTLTRKILELKTRHNSLSVTARLPDELLARVFTWNLSMQRSDRKVGWIKVAGVCTSWRRVALACPHLWSFIRHRGTKWLNNVIFPRSGSVPLHVSVDLSSSSTWAAFRRVSDEIHRVRELRFHVAHRRNAARAQKFLSGLIKPAPILENFDFTPECGTTRTMYQLPDNLFAKQAPRLRKLALGGCAISASSPLIVGLTSLVLRRLSGEGGLNLSLLTTLLQSTVNLENLTLRSACHFTADDLSIVPIPSTYRVILPHLKYLSLGNDIKDCLILLSCIAHSMATHLNININLSSMSECDTIHTLGNMLGSWISSINHITIDNPTYYKRKIEAKRTQELINGIALDPMVFRVHFRSLHFLPMLLHRLPLTALRSLEVNGTFSARFIVDVFGDIASLHTIRVKGGDILDLCRALLSGVSKGELMDTVTTGEEKWVGVSGDSSEQPSISTQNTIASKQQDKDSEENNGTEDEVDNISEAETTVSGDVSEASQDQLSDEERLLRLKLSKVSGPLRFTSLKSLEIDPCQGDNTDSFSLDTAVLAAVIHLRYSRGSPIQELSVQRSTHYSLNADQHLATIRRFVKSNVYWDVENGLFAVPEEETRQQAMSDDSDISESERSS